MCASMGAHGHKKGGGVNWGEGARKAVGPHQWGTRANRGRGHVKRGHMRMPPPCEQGSSGGQGRQTGEQGDA